MEKTSEEKYSDYLKIKASKLKEALLKFPNLLDLSLLVDNLEKDLDSSDAQIQEIVNLFLDYIGHIKSLSEHINEYNDKSKEFSYKPERANELIKLQGILQKLIPLKKLIFDEIKNRKIKGESIKNIQIFIDKFNKGHGIHDLAEAIRYWDIYSFFEKKSSKIEIFKENIKTKIFIFLNIFLDKIRGVKELKNSLISKRESAL